MNLRKEINGLINIAEAAGWRVEKRRAGHVVFKSSDGVNQVTCGGTPSECRGFRNLKAQLRRAGLTLPH